MDYDTWLLNGAERNMTSTVDWDEYVKNCADEYQEKHGEFEDLQAEDAWYLENYEAMRKEFEQ